MGWDGMGWKKARRDGNNGITLEYVRKPSAGWLYATATYLIVLCMCILRASKRHK